MHTFQELKTLITHLYTKILVMEQMKRT